MRHLLLSVSTALLCFATAPAHAALTLETIMADPDWIGPPVEQPYWSVNGTAVYYQLKRSGSAIRDLHRLQLTNGDDQVIDGAAMALSDGRDAVFDTAHHNGAFIRNGDVFVRELANGTLRQITRTPQEEAAPQFSADGRSLQFHVGNDWYVHDLASGVTAPLAIVKLEKDPTDKKPDALRDLQLHWFSTLKQAHDDTDAARHHAEDLQRADPTRAPLPFFIDDDIQIADSAASPNGRWLLLVTTPKAYEAGKVGKLTRYVTESGYEEFEDERTRVGRSDPAPHSLLLLDLEKHEKFALAYSSLPGIKDDPLKSIREKNLKPEEKTKDAKKNETSKDKNKKPEAKERLLQVVGSAWSRDGMNLALELRANDNKDRWIATVDFSKHALEPQHRLTDPAWINWNNNEFGWENDNRSLWYLSEESGYSHLYARTLGDKQAKVLTQGRFEISQPTLDREGRFFYARTNREQPYAYDVYRVPVTGGELQRVTQLQGVENFALSPDGKQLLVSHSASYIPVQLSLQPSDGSNAAKALTDTRSANFKAMSWLQPEIIAVPSTHTKQPIYAKYYQARSFDSAKTHPAVIFVHGAGYLQNTILSYPHYFREQMFHQLLTEHGYVVLDMDYRASEGYGRDWRTAIYRQMGHPELEDLLDGKAWLVKNHHVDPKRVGIYGGSYGGFMTLMALFRAPDEFAVGAALRPVTDWSQYNHEYSANILNTPQIDPEAYQTSSPLEYAAGLKHPLLICHGVIDDNVFFADSIRLYQRLIELHKDNFEISPYPLDRHAFSHADSWLDEYKRIYKLFETM